MKKLSILYKRVVCACFLNFMSTTHYLLSFSPSFCIALCDTKDLKITEKTPKNVSNFKKKIKKYLIKELIELN